MIEGKCPKCGKTYYGWALLDPRHQSCLECKVGLLITEDGKKTVQGHSPFTAEEYKNTNQILEPCLIRRRPKTKL